LQGRTLSATEIAVNSAGSMQGYSTEGAGFVEDG